MAAENTNNITLNVGEENMQGKVIWFKKTYGFIKQAEGEDLFVHWSDIVSDGFKTLKKGQTVSYEIGLNNKGQPKAINVKTEEESS